MECLYQINPVLRDKEIIIYGTGERHKRIFLALLQQDIRVSAFCRKEFDGAGMNEVFGKRVMGFDELKDHRDAYIIISGDLARADSEQLRHIDTEHIVVENISSNAQGILLDED